MTEQFSLDLVQPIRYTSTGFVLHQGVAEAIDTLSTLSTKRGFSLSFVQGGEQSGKTHLGVYLAGQHRKRNGSARLIQGSDLSRWFNSELPRAPIAAWEMVVLDDADSCLGDPTSQGILVDLIERVSRQKGSVVFLSASNPDSIQMSAQLRSRVSAGVHVSLGDPREEDLDALLDCITKQRGLQLSESKRSYILKRVERTIPALVECVERVEDRASTGDPSTSFKRLAGVVG